MGTDIYAKKDVIISLLDRLRIYNIEIGEYQKSLLTPDFTYSVKLTNGRILLSDDLVDSFEQLTDSLTDQQYKRAAEGFIANDPKPDLTSQSEPTRTTEYSAVRTNIPKSVWIVIIVVALVGGWIFLSSNESHLPEVKQVEVVREKTPQELRNELLAKERQTPTAYLHHSGGWRRNLLGQIVLEGTIENKASIANFKDVELQITWLTRTNTEIGTSAKTIYEYVKSGQSVPYKLRFNVPSGTRDVRVEIGAAVAVE
jgi:hypothetical protein